MKQELKHSKIAIVGTGMVGSSFAYALAIKGYVHHMALINHIPEKAVGEAMDINDGLPFILPMEIEAGGYKQCEDAHIVVICAGVPRKEGDSRLDLMKRNVEVIEEVVPKVLKHNPDPIFLVVSNPVDILTYVTLKISGLKPHRVMGSGTVLDSARFSYQLSKNCNVDPRSMHAYVIGEHGDSEVLVWSRANIGGVSLDECCDACKAGCDPSFKETIDVQVRKAGQEIIKRKGVTNYAIGLALTRIVEAIMKDELSMLTVSSLMQGQYGMNDLCLSLPCIVGFQGVKRIIEGQLSGQEFQALKNSASILRNNLDQLGY